MAPLNTPHSGEASTPNKTESATRAYGALWAPGAAKLEPGSASKKCRPSALRPPSLDRKDGDPGLATDSKEGSHRASTTATRRSTHYSCGSHKTRMTGAHSSQPSRPSYLRATRRHT